MPDPEVDRLIHPMPSRSETGLEVVPAFQSHPRTYRENRFVYPVISRRSRGVSVGINLNPDKVCNFDCVYCQVDRTVAGASKFVALEQLVEELDRTLELVTSGRLFDDEAFRDIPEALRRLNDIAFSGDGEPTTYTNFSTIVAECAAVKRRRDLDAVKMVLITNASRFHRPRTQEALATLMANHGEIWAKLDAGTEAYYQRVNRASISFTQIVNNLQTTARRWPLVIQSLFMRLGGDPPSSDEVAAYCDRLNAITSGGGSILRVQVYTVARRPAETDVSPLSTQEIEAIAETVRSRTGLTVETFC